MSNTTRALILFVLTLFTASSISRGGNEAGGGDNKNPTDDAAWFLGDRAIRYCSEIDSEFGVSSGEIALTLQGVFNTWRAYLVEKKIWSHAWNVEKGMFLKLNTQAMDHCDGTEDLKFYFGVVNAEVLKAKAQFHNPSAFVYRKSYDTKKGWGQGFVWLARPGSVFKGFPDWTKPYRLHGMLLHEIGHVLGCDHVQGTIMTSFISSLLQGMGHPEARVQSMLTHIDDLSELASCFGCTPILYSGTISDKQGDVSEGLTFRKFMGRDAVGKIKAHFLFAPKPVLTLGDDVSDKAFELPSFVQGNHIDFWGNGTFLIAKEVDNGAVLGVSMPSAGQVNFTSLTAQDGTLYNVALERNSIGGAVKLSYLDQGRRLSLFFPRVPGARF